jgi:hypothetical protein
MTIQGEVVAFSSPRAGASCRGQAYPDLVGWHVMFRYQCSCGAIHDTDSFKVWPTGDFNSDIVRTTCPVTGELIEVELTRPK